jgi:beta-glucosidase
VTALGKPVVLVLMNGSALAVNWARDHVPAIVEAWYPGQAGGAALADVLFGDYNPAGRLPVTFYKSVDQLPPFTDYRMKGRTYRYFEGEPLFPFGYGLSYTSFAYRKLNVPKRVSAGADAQVTVEVENTGVVAGEEVVQLYLSGTAPNQPLRSLQGFQRISLRPKERKTVQFTIPSRTFVQPGTFQISLGGRQPGAGVTGVVTGTMIVN